MKWSTPSPFMPKVGRRAASAGFSLIEILVVVAVLAIGAALAVSIVGKVHNSVAKAKLSQDVAQLNSSIRLYQSAGGSLTGVTDPQDVLDKLKTMVTDTDGNDKELMFVKKAMVDKRLEAVTSERGSDGRFRWSKQYVKYNGTTEQFEITERLTRGAFYGFALNEAQLAKDYGKETRLATLKQAKVKKWVWDYNTVAMEAAPAPPLPTSTGGSEVVTPPSVSTPAKATPPEAMPAPPQINLSSYPLSVTLGHTNDPGVTEIVYRSVPGSGSDEVYSAPIDVLPFTTITAWVRSTNPAALSDSDPQMFTYEPEGLKLEFIDDLHNEMTYMQAGGKMASGSPAVAAITPGKIKLYNAGSVPSRYQDSTYFQAFWTKDGSDPTSSPSKITGMTFSNGYSGDPVPVELLDFRNNQNCVVSYVAVAKSRLFTTSDIGRRVIRPKSTLLPPPLISPGSMVISSTTTITLSSDIASGTVPEGVRIFYTTDGSDPGDVDGEPATSATLYTQPFIIDNSSGNSTTVVARCYPPVQFKTWFTTSPSASAIYSSSVGGIEFYATTGVDKNIYQLNPRTGAQVAVCSDCAFFPGTVAYDREARGVYYTKKGSYEVARWNQQSGVQESLGSLKTAPGGSQLESAPDSLTWFKDSLYWIEDNSDNLFKAQISGSTIQWVAKVADLSNNSDSYVPGDLAIDDSGILFFADNGLILTKLYRYDIVRLSGLLQTGTMLGKVTALGFSAGFLYCQRSNSNNCERLDISEGASLGSVATSPAKVFIDYAAPTANVSDVPSDDLWAILPTEPRLVAFRNYKNYNGNVSAADYGVICVQNGASLVPLSNTIGIHSLTISSEGKAYFVGNKSIKIGSVTYDRPLFVVDVASQQLGAKIVATLLGDVGTVLSTVIPGYSDATDRIVGLAIGGDGKLYAAVRNGTITDADALVRFDALIPNASGSITTASLVGLIEASGDACSNTGDITFDASGQLYASDEQDGEIYLVDPATASIVSIYSAESSCRPSGLALLRDDGDLVISDLGTAFPQSIAKCQAGVGNDTGYFSYSTEFGYGDIQAISFFGGTLKKESAQSSTIWALAEKSNQAILGRAIDFRNSGTAQWEYRGDLFYRSNGSVVKISGSDSYINAFTVDGDGTAWLVRNESTTISGVTYGRPLFKIATGSATSVAGAECMVVGDLQSALEAAKGGSVNAGQQVDLISGLAIGPDQALYFACEVGDAATVDKLIRLDSIAADGSGTLTGYTLLGEIAGVAGEQSTNTADLCFGADNQLRVTDLEDGKVYVVDPNTAAIASILSTESNSELHGITLDAATAEFVATDSKSEVFSGVNSGDDNDTAYTDWKSVFNLNAVKGVAYPSGTVSDVPLATRSVWAVVQKGYPRLVQYLNYTQNASVREIVWGELRYWSNGVATSFPTSSRPNRGVISSLAISAGGTGWFLAEQPVSIDGVTYAHALFQIELANKSPGTFVVAKFVGNVAAIDDYISGWDNSCVTPGLALGPDKALYGVASKPGESPFIFKITSFETGSSMSLPGTTLVGKIDQTFAPTDLTFAGTDLMVGNTNATIGKVDLTTMAWTMTNSETSGGFSQPWGLAVNPETKELVTGVMFYVSASPDGSPVRIKGVVSGDDNDTEYFNATDKFAHSSLGGLSFWAGEFTPQPLAQTGPIFVAGDLQNSAGTGRGVAKLAANGSIDSSFNVGSGANAGSTVRALVPLASGKVCVGGDFTAFNGQGRTGLVRLNSDGSVDTSFNPNITAGASAGPLISLDWANWTGFQQNVAGDGTDTWNGTMNEAYGLSSATGGTTGFKSQTWSNIQNSGVNMTLHWSQNMTDSGSPMKDDGPDLYGDSISYLGGVNPDRRITGHTALRFNNDRKGTFTPVTVVASFSEPVFLDQVLWGSLSNIGGTSSGTPVNLLANASFETGNWAPNGTFVTAQAVIGKYGGANFSEWSNSDITDWIEDATRAPDGNRFAYLRGGDWTTCFGMRLTGGPLGSGAKLISGKTYRLTYDFALFNPAIPGGSPSITGRPQADMMWHTPSGWQFTALPLSDASNDVPYGFLPIEPWNGLTWKRGKSTFVMPDVDNPNVSLWISSIVQSPSYGRYAAIQSGVNYMNSYNVVTTLDLIKGPKLEGSAFIGRNLTDTGAVSIGENNTASGIRTAIVAGTITGSATPITFTGGGIMALRSAGAASGRTISLSGGSTVAYDAALNILSVKVKEDLEARSKAYADIPANSTISSAVLGTVRNFDCNPQTVAGQPGIAVFNVNAADLFTPAGILIANLDKASGVNWNDIKAVLINVRGAAANWTNSMVMSGKFADDAWRSKVLWNFPEATAVALGSHTMQGALLAPLAAVTSTSNFYGSVAAQSLSTTGTCYYRPFAASELINSVQPGLPAGILIDNCKLEEVSDIVGGAYEHAYFRAFATPDATGAPVAADSYLNISDRTAPLLGVAADPITTADLANVRMDNDTSDNIYHTIGAGLQSEGRYGRVSLSYSSTPVRSIAMTFWTSADTETVSGSQVPKFDGVLTDANSSSTFSALGFRRAAGTPGKVWAIEEMPDGKLLIGGEFTQINGVPRKNIARLNADGTLDATFDPGVGPNGPVYALARHASGKVYLGGDFVQYGATNCRSLARLNADGSFDAAFVSPLVGTESAVNWVKVRPDDRVLIGGDFDSPWTGIALLEATGAAASGFDPGDSISSTGVVYEGVISSSNEVTLVGSFTQFDGQNRGNIARIAASGALLPWGAGNGFDSAARSITALSSGVYGVAGDFTTAQAVTVNHVAQLLPTASLAPNFGPPGLVINRLWKVRPAVTP